jgi:pyruvate/2-oxoglutarate dehydrogenase complex dihydrolipoamide acyltransferase (E2) component
MSAQEPDPTTEPPAEATPPAPEKSSFQVVAEDAERIASHIVPALNRLPEVVGVVIAELQKIAPGGRLEHLSDDELGVNAAAVAPEAAGTEAGRIAELEATVEKLAAQITSMHQPEAPPEEGEAPA